MFTGKIFGINGGDVSIDGSSISVTFESGKVEPATVDRKIIKKAIEDGYPSFMDDIGVKPIHGDVVLRLDDGNTMSVRKSEFSQLLS